jgi:hypothetical protein
VDQPAVEPFCRISQRLNIPGPVDPEAQRGHAAGACAFRALRRGGAVHAISGEGGGAHCQQP